MSDVMAGIRIPRLIYVRGTSVGPRGPDAGKGSGVT